MFISEGAQPKCLQEAPALTLHNAPEAGAHNTAGRRAILASPPQMPRKGRLSGINMHASGWDMSHGQNSSRGNYIGYVCICICIYTHIVIHMYSLFVNLSIHMGSLLRSYQASHMLTSPSPKQSLEPRSVETGVRHSPRVRAIPFVLS